MDPNARTFDLGSDKYRLARPRYPAGLYEALAGLCPGLVRAWDCGCGNGQVASDLVTHFDRVEASDISENQIQNAHQDPKIVNHGTVLRRRSATGGGSAFTALRRDDAFSSVVRANRRIRFRAVKSRSLNRWKNRSVDSMSGLSRFIPGP
jgi:hypothetical protein